MGNVYTSMQGKVIDMEKLAIKHELTPAIGNMKVNARGDEIGDKGQIIRTREDILKDYYKDNARAIEEETSKRTKG